MELYQKAFYVDSAGVEWIIIKQRKTPGIAQFGFYPRHKGPNCIEADAAGTVKGVEELIEHMASADDAERARWGKENKRGWRKPGGE